MLQGLVHLGAGSSEATAGHVVFFGLQYLIKAYLVGAVVDEDKVDEAEAFVARYMADVRVAGPNFAKGFFRLAKAARMRGLHDAALAQHRGDRPHARLVRKAGGGSAPSV